MCVLGGGHQCACLVEHRVHNERVVANHAMPICVCVGGGGAVVVAVTVVTMILAAGSRSSSST